MSASVSTILSMLRDDCGRIPMRLILVFLIEVDPRDGVYGHEAEKCPDP